MKERLAEVLNLEWGGLLTACWVFAYLFYLFFLRKLSATRHLLIRRLLKEALLTFVGFAAFFGIYLFLVNQNQYVTAEIYIGIATLLLGALFFIRTCKILVNEYLFLSSMREGVPVLLVNMVTLVISLFILSWMLTSIFGVKIAPLLATSALLSVVLGLALQDTLGNLFAGVALQFDKPYEIGDWIEVHTDQEVVVGKVHEITWRATVMFGFFDELLTVPNRLMSQSRIRNFSGRLMPVYHGFSLHLDPNADEAIIRNVLEEIIKNTQGILQNHPHFIMLRELTEKGAHWRVVYPIENYGILFQIVDHALIQVQSEFKKRSIALGRIRVDAQGTYGNPKNA